MASSVRIGRVALRQDSPNQLYMTVTRVDGVVETMRLARTRFGRDDGPPVVEIDGDARSSVVVRVDNATVGDDLLAMLARAYESVGRTILANRIRDLVTDDKRTEGRGRLLTSDISALMEAVDKRRGDIVPCLLGSPGIGKTEGIEEFARTHGRDVVHIIASQVLPTEVSGMTMPNQETHSMDVFDHARLSRMRDGDILFLDELLKGQQQVLSACLTLVQERRLMSGTRLPDVIIVAAANPLASAKMLPEEIRQRFLFVDVEFDAMSWCEYMRERGVPRPDILTSRLVTSGDGGAEWNTLTPRTMTKLTLWYRDSGHDPIVRRVIETEFGEDVLRAIDRALGNDVRARRKPMDEVREFIAQEMSKLPSASTEVEEESRREVASMLREEAIDVAELMGRIQAMSGGSEIMEALRNETIDLSLTGIGEE